MARECSGSLRRPLLVNLNHDLMGVLYRIGNCADRCWHFLSAWVLRQLTGCKNRSSNQQNALAAFVHETDILRFRFLFVYDVLFLGDSRAWPVGFVCSR